MPSSVRPPAVSSTLRATPADAFSTATCRPPDRRRCGYARSANLTSRLSGDVKGCNVFRTGPVNADLRFCQEISRFGDNGREANDHETAWLLNVERAITARRRHDLNN